MGCPTGDKDPKEAPVLFWSRVRHIFLLCFLVGLQCVCYAPATHAWGSINIFGQCKCSMFPKHVTKGEFFVWFAVRSETQGCEWGLSADKKQPPFSFCPPVWPYFVSDLKRLSAIPGARFQSIVIVNLNPSTLAYLRFSGRFVTWNNLHF